MPEVQPPTLDSLLRLLHPMIPFITEEVWQLLGQTAQERGLTELEPAAESIMIARWPQADRARQNPQIEARFARFQEVLEGLRKVRSQRNIPTKEIVRFGVRSDANTTDLLKPMWPSFEAMAGATVVGWGPQIQGPPSGPTFVLAWADVFVDLTPYIDVEDEIARRIKELEELGQRIAGKERQLANANFVARAPAEVVEQERASLALLKTVHDSTKSTIDVLRSGKQ